MNVILLDHIEKVGAKHDVVKVKDGFGRNYLIPRGLAIVANKPNMARLDGIKKQAAKKELAMLGTYLEYVAKINAATLTVVAKAGESGRLFGSVTAQHLLTAIKEQLGIDVEKRMVEMPDEVKELGAYEATVRFHTEAVATAKFEVVGEGREVPAARPVEPAPVAAPAPVAIPEPEPAPEPAAAIVEAAAEEEPVSEAAEVVEEAAEEAADTMAEVAEDTDGDQKEDA